MLSKPTPQPKPTSSRGKRTRLHERKMAAFRQRVWEKFGSGVGEDEGAPCAHCGRWVFRRRQPIAAVDHIAMRSTSPEKKYDPENGQILCNDTCHLQGKHGRTDAATV